MIDTASDADVVIVGGGPAGMMLGAELALAGVDVVIIERRPDQVLVGSRAGGFHSRTIEVLDQRGVVDRFLDAGQTAQATMIGSTVLDMSDFPSRHPYALGIFQNKIEAIMADWLRELPVTVAYGHEVIGLAQDDSGVDVELAGGESVRAQYLVGCDGARSLVRTAAGIAFPGWPATKSNLIAEVETTEDLPEGTRHDEVGIHGLQRLPDSGLVRVIVTERELRTGEATLLQLKDALVTVYGCDYGVHDPVWLSRFTDATRQAAAYRAGRVLLAGDAAHIHYPAGGQGITLAIQDAVNLGWKLAQVVSGTSPGTLLDTYHAERHPVAARALRHTKAQAALQRRDDTNGALVDLVTELARMDEPRKLIAGLISGLDIHYDLGDGHPLLGRRVPDLDLTFAGGSTRVYAFLRDARPALINFGEPGDLDVCGWADRVRLVDARYTGAWELPVLGPVKAPTAVLVRPDGYVAWVGDGAQLGLRKALETWFGAPDPYQSAGT